ncbi:hypothetical protein OpiT1DRAFT_02705 [Opitutaceae bacterium TAV1]|nr:anchor protein [Opitutaceae bacterium TAV5]EIP98253.1 hypothetical protein OpiT1DRAFT_02705 [Opitutaceae bacterium TAV1]
MTNITQTPSFPALHFPVKTAAIVCAMCLALAPAFSSSLRAALVPFTEEFTGAAVDSSRWTEYKSGSNASLAVADGKLTAATTSTGSTNRAVIISKSSAINPFEQALRFSFSGLSISGNPGTGANAFYALLGNVDSDAAGANFYPTKGPSTGNGWTSLLIEKKSVDSTDVLQLTVRERTAGVSIIDTTYSLSAMPTIIDWTIDGTGTGATWSLTLTGATLTGGSLGTTTSSSVSGTFTNFASTHLAAGSWLALGCFNNGAVATGGTSISLDAVGVAAAVPEPAQAVALFGVGALAAAGIVLRRIRRI